MTQSRTKFVTLLKGDMEAIERPWPSIFFLIGSMLGLYRFSAVLLFRLASACHRRGGVLRGVSHILRRWNHVLNSCEIMSDAEIGKGLLIPHPVGLVIAPLVAGERLTIRQNVTVGLRNPDRGTMPTSAELPVMGNDVTLGVGAVILGPIRLGDGAVVAANAVVLKDVPPYATAVGVPARCLPARRPAAPAGTAVEDAVPLSSSHASWEETKG